MSLSSKPGLQLTVIPLTQNLGLNESERTRGIVHIYGNLKPANASTYQQISGFNDVAYLSCDKPSGDSFINPDSMLTDLMNQRPKAIVLYSTSRNWCKLSDDQALPYTSILTMVDAGEASNVLSYLNGSSPTAGGDVKVFITGNATTDQDGGDGSADGGSTNNSAVAMSILYSITGLITVLFLIIIATGAVRAHRYPERYGPRGAFDGRPRQSRAKGLARAVLDTIPIVKFGNQRTTKPDPELELDTATVDGRDVTGQTTDANRTHDRQPSDTAATVPRPSGETLLSGTNADASENRETSDEHLGCSICTDDFKVGEDVRVLPCNHQYHPRCVDPWLVNVSGTCPLCRLDLRPDSNKRRSSATAGAGAEDDASLPPPLAMETDEASTASHAQSSRLSRLLDINRLRQAPVEERMEALRQMRSETREDGSHTGDEAESRHRARLTDRLKDKFRIRTRAQSAGHHQTD
ncbi:hypothetical protein CDD82_126 [Ophiocordyceps australis]|uniref:RING-type E3 ubiquitin transferase n=1 Tax=Ophiocordyceps australis TaxID=1399860 RepID=A0A2C5YJT2_9HYPO|nr:hypothetical protein CDD82_126 [Ophiocordyceps australis]